MALRRPRSAALACALAASLALGACGTKGSDHHPVREGIGVNLGGLDYNVYITRQLNLKDIEDRSYYRGPEAPPGSSYYGVFLSVCNAHEDGPERAAAREFELTDAQGNKFEPIELPEENEFAYRPAPLGPKKCNPQVGSIASLGPTGGVLLLFRVPNNVVENRPLELEIHGPFDPEKGRSETRAVELDI